MGLKENFMRAPENGDFPIFWKSRLASQEPNLWKWKMRKMIQINPDLCIRGNLGWLVDIFSLQILKIFYKVFKRKFGKIYM